MPSEAIEAPIDDVTTMLMMWRARDAITKRGSEPESDLDSDSDSDLDYNPETELPKEFRT